MHGVLLLGSIELFCSCHSFMLWICCVTPAFVDYLRFQTYFTARGGFLLDSLACRNRIALHLKLPRHLFFLINTLNIVVFERGG